MANNISVSTDERLYAYVKIDEKLAKGSPDYKNLMILREKILALQKNRKLPIQLNPNSPEFKFIARNLRSAWGNTLKNKILYFERNPFEKNRLTSPWLMPTGEGEDLPWIGDLNKDGDKDDLIIFSETVAYYMTSALIMSLLTIIEGPEKYSSKEEWVRKAAKDLNVFYGIYAFAKDEMRRPDGGFKWRVVYDTDPSKTRFSNSETASDADQIIAYNLVLAESLARALPANMLPLKRRTTENDAKETIGYMRNHVVAKHGKDMVVTMNENTNYILDPSYWISAAHALFSVVDPQDGTWKNVKQNDGKWALASSLATLNGVKGNASVIPNFCQVSGSISGSPSAQHIAKKLTDSDWHGQESGKGNSYDSSRFFYWGLMLYRQLGIPDDYYLNNMVMRKYGFYNAVKAQLNSRSAPLQDTDMAGKNGSVPQGRDMVRQLACMSGLMYAAGDGKTLNQFQQRMFTPPLFNPSDGSFSSNTSYQDFNVFDGAVKKMQLDPATRTQAVNFNAEKMEYFASIQAIISSGLVLAGPYLGDMQLLIMQENGYKIPENLDGFKIDNKKLSEANPEKKGNPFLDTITGAVSNIFKTHKTAAGGNLQDFTRIAESPFNGASGGAEGDKIELRNPGGGFDAGYAMYFEKTLKGKLSFKVEKGSCAILFFKGIAPERWQEDMPLRKKVVSGPGIVTLDIPEGTNKINFMPQQCEHVILTNVSIK